MIPILTGNSGFAFPEDTRSYLVREWDDGSIEYYHEGDGRWCLLPAEWTDTIVWE